MAVEIARPVLSSYARRKPMQYLGLAALAGAGLFFLRPWKLISVTGLLVAVVKSSHVAELVMRAMSVSDEPAGRRTRAGMTGEPAGVVRPGRGA